MKQAAPHRRNPAWRSVGVMLALAVLSLAYVALLEFGRWRDHAIQVDELYFSACAARGLAVGQFPIAGCHDNKGPMILLIHQLVQMASSTYDLVAIKVAAYAVVVLVAGAAAMLAHRLAGPLAGASAAALMLQALVTQASHLALKTETVGVFFLLASLIVAIGPLGRQGAWRLFASGVLLGLAVMTKQTFAFAAVATVGWLGWSSTGNLRARLRTCAAGSVAFGVGVLVPFGIFLLAFALANRQSEFLSAFFVYPSVYGTVGADPLYKRWGWTIGSVLSAMGSTVLMSTLFFGGVLRTILASASQHSGTRAAAQPRVLLLLVTVMMLATLLLAPAFYPYHIVPLQVLMAVFGGVLISDLAIEVHNALPRASPYLFWSVVMPSVLMAASTWSSNGGDWQARGTGSVLQQSQALPDAARGEFAYVLGMRPGFYAYNGLIPASDVLFPWALTGAPANFFFTPPPPGSARALGLAWAQQQASEALFADFRQTPPRHIIVIRDMARAADSKRISDVPGFDEYLHEACVYIQEVGPSDKTDASLYRCTAPEGSQRGQPSTQIQAKPFLAPPIDPRAESKYRP